MTVKQILLRNIDQVTDSQDGTFQPSDALLDEIWTHAVETTTDRGRLMSDVINGDEAIDYHLIALAATGSMDEALALRKVAQGLFRDHAYSVAKEYEYEVMEDINAKPGA